MLTKLDGLSFDLIMKILQGELSARAYGTKGKLLNKVYRGNIGGRVSKGRSRETWLEEKDEDLREM